MNKTRTTIRLDEQDKAAIAAIKDYYGISSDNDALRSMLRDIQGLRAKARDKPA